MMREDGDTGATSDEVHSLEARMAALETSNARLEKAIDGMVRVWEAGNTFLRVIKWCAIVGAALATLWTAVKLNIVHTP